MLKIRKRYWIWKSGAHSCALFSSLNGAMELSPGGSEMSEGGFRGWKYSTMYWNGAEAVMAGQGWHQELEWKT